MSLLVRRCSWLVSWAAVLLLGLTGAGQTPEPDAAIDVPRRLGLEACFVLALRHNKDIRAAQLLAAAQRARVTAAEGEFDVDIVAENRWTRRDDPDGLRPKDDLRTAEGALSAGFVKRFISGTEVDVRTALDYTDDRDDNAPYDPLIASDFSVQIRQDLLRNRGSEVNGTGILVARDGWNMATEGVRDSLIRNLLEVEQAYWGLFFALADLGVREAQLARANRLVAVAESQVRVGQAAPIEITRARSSAASQAVAILDAKNTIASLKRRLLRFLGVLDPKDPDQVVELEDAPPQPAGTMALQDCLETAFERRPDCVQAQIDVARSQRREVWADNQRLPSLRLYGGVGLRGLDSSISGSGGDVAEGQFDTWQVGIRLDVPLGNRVAEGTFQAAAADRRRAAIQRRAVLEHATREVADALDDLNTAEKRIDTARQSQELATDLMQAEEKSFQLGRSSSLDVLSAQQSLASAEREEVRARVAYAAALSVLLAVRGDFIEAKGLRDEVALNAQD